MIAVAAAVTVYLAAPPLRHQRHHRVDQARAQAGAVASSPVVSRGALERAHASAVEAPTKVIVEAPKLVAEASLQANPSLRTQPTLLDGDPLSSVMPPPRSMRAAAADNQ